MLKDSLPRSTCSILTGLLAAMAVAPPATVSAANAENPTKRVAAEATVGGITAEEHAARHNRLRAELLAEIPDGTFQAPIRAELTQQDRADLAVQPNVNGPAPLRIGVVKTISPGVGFVRGQAGKRGAIQEARDGGFVWAVTVTSPDAQAIRVHFTDFSLPPNTEVYFFSLNGQAHGPYTGTGRNGNGDFWTRSIASDTGVIQLRYTGSKADRREISFAISDLGHIHGRPPRLGRAKPARAGRAGDPAAQSHDTWPCSDNAICVVDANCVSGTPADVAKNAIAKLEWIEGVFINTCSGGLIADTDPSTQMPYLLTANHCFASSNSTLETFFFYTTDACNGVCPDSLVTGGTPPPSSTIGVTVVATGSVGDFTLLTLDQNPPAGTTFLGWNNSPVAFTNGANLYRISNPNFGPQGYSQHDVDAAAVTCGGWPRGERIYSNSITGATMGGSSGSPVLNSAGEVVGQLSGCCGFNCANNCDSASNSTVDGALAFYWNSVSAFLDPAVGCTTNADCDDGLACNGTETCTVATGNCQAGTPVDCNDGIACTVDSCADPLGTCGNTPDNGLCNDGNACTTDACDTGTGCANSAITPCCGNATCETGEDCNTCSTDCFSSAPSTAECGNGICESFNRENCKRCAEDCAGTEQGPFCCGNLEDGDNPVPCSDPRCTEAGFQCIDAPTSASCCGDLICEGSENNINCAVDCGPPAVCGDGFCDPGEDQCNCAVDCGAPPATEVANVTCNDGLDNDCDGLSDCADPDCATDPACQPCLPDGSPCTNAAECCRNRCRDRDGAMICD